MKPTVVGIDPGLDGAFVVIEPDEKMYWYLMPVLKMGKQREVNPTGVAWLVERFQYIEDVQVFLERAIPFAMGAKSAFNYGRGFAAIEIALGQAEIPVTYVEPAKWTKIMHQGTDARLKPKERSLVAARRLVPKMLKNVPIGRSGRVNEGVLDALLIAEYGRRSLA